MAELVYLEQMRRKFGWEDFPFTLDLIPEVFAGKERILDPVMEQLAFGNIVFIEGNYGSGKSQILKHIQYTLRNDARYSRYIPLLIQEPLSTEILVHAFTRRFAIESTITRINDLVDELETRIGSKNVLILLVDEAQELVVQDTDAPDIIEEKQKTLQWLRVLADTRGCKIFLAGLVNFGKRLTEMFRPLDDRVTLKFFLNPLDYETTVELIKQRVRFFSGNQKSAITPFSEGAFKVIYQLSGGYPRAILKVCQDAVIKMFTKGRDSVDADDILPAGAAKSVMISPSIIDVKAMEVKDLEREMKSFRDQLAFDSSSLNYTEIETLKFLAIKEDVTPQDVAEGIGITAGTAGNILRKLKEMGYTFRKKQGRTFSYTLYSHYRREFTRA